MGRCRSMRVVEGSCRSLRVVVGRCGSFLVVVGRCRSVRVVVGRWGSLVNDTQQQSTTIWVPGLTAIIFCQLQVGNKTNDVRIKNP